MNKIFFLFTITILNLNVYSQTGHWLEVRANDTSIHGASGVFDTAYSPPALVGAFHWTDKQGKFWLYKNNMWEFDPAIGQWAWIDSSGPQNRSNGASWVDTAGNFWMFGGAGGFYSDLWKYTITANQWTKMKGPTLNNVPAIHAGIGVEDTLNNPAACENSVGWTDANNNLWMFGGDFFYIDNWADHIYINYSDLWKFNISTNNWTWMGDSTGGPSGRACFAHWSDSDHNLWLFGGSMIQSWLVNCNYCDIGSFGISDLWKYDIITNQWLAKNFPPGYHSSELSYNYPPVCTTDDTIPPGTDYSTACWNRGCDNFEFYGGYNYVYIHNWGGEWLLDTNMWNYNVNTNQWTLMSKGANFPANGENAISWSDNAGNPWLFGGGSPANNYVWEYIADSTCPSVLNTYPVHCSFYTNDTMGCNPLAVSFQNTSTNAVHYLWVFGDGDSSMVANPVHMYTTSGTYTVKLFVYNPLVCSNTQDSLTMVNYITVSDSVHAGFFSDSLFGCNPLTVIFINQSYNAIGYYWDFGDGTNSTTINPTHVYDSTGVFTVKLIAYGAGVCNDTAVYSNLISVGASCHSSFQATDTVRCDSIHFINNSVNATSYKWFFGDGDSSIVVNPIHQYLDTGYYTVRLISFYNGICGNASDTMTRLNYIHFPNYNLYADLIVLNNDTIGCSPFSVTFYGYNWNHNYFWNLGNGDTVWNTAGPVNTIYINPGSYTVTLIDYSALYGCIDTVVKHNFITVLPIPTPSIITQSGDTLFSNDSTGNNWYWNNAIYLSSNPYIIVSNSGCYTVRQYNSYNCYSSSDTICFNFTGINDIVKNEDILIYPNPNDGNFTITSSCKMNYEIGIFDMIGREVYHQVINNSTKATIDISQCSNGIYLYQLTNNKETLRGKFIKD
jgi:PKD repeat protein